MQNEQGFKPGNQCMRNQCMHMHRQTGVFANCMNGNLPYFHFLSSTVETLIADIPLSGHQTQGPIFLL